MLKILAVDDEIMNIEILRMYLEDILGDFVFHEKLTYPDIINDSYDIIFLDLWINGKGPEDLINTINNPIDKIIFISGSEDDLNEWLKKGYKGIKKPISSDLLKSVLEEFIPGLN